MKYIELACWKSYDNYVDRVESVLVLVVLVDGVVVTIDTTAGEESI